MKALSIKTINDLIPDPVNKKVLTNSDGITRDIVHEVLQNYSNSRNQLKQFGPLFQGKTLLETCSNIWHFWKEHVKYKIDPEGVQWIKTPSAFWNEGRDPFGDCKSFAIACAASLHALDIKGAFRFVSFGSNRTAPTHVYVVVKNLGQEIIIDCVWKRFNEEAPNISKKWDYNMTSIYQISGIDTDNGRGILQVDESNIGDLTDNELDLLADKQLLEVEQQLAVKKTGIGSTLDNAYELELMANNNALAEIGRARGSRNKFRPLRIIAKGPAGNPKKRVPQVRPSVLVDAPEVYEDDDSVGDIGKVKAKTPNAPKAKKAAKEQKNVQQAVKRNEAGKGINKKDAKRLQQLNVVVKKKKENILKIVALAPARLAVALPKALLQGVLKVELPKNASFFLYLFLDDPKDLARSAKILSQIPEIVRVKREKALSAKKIIVDKIKMKPDTFDKIVRAGIMKRYGKSPEEQLAQWMKEGNFVIGFVEVAAQGIQMLIKKIGGSINDNLENFSPDPADWGIVAPEEKQAMATEVRQYPSNNDVNTGRGTVQNKSEDQMIDEPTSASPTNPEGTTYNDYDRSGINQDDLPTGDMNKTNEMLPVVVTGKKKVTASTAATNTDNTWLYLGLGAVALMAMSNKK